MNKKYTPTEIEILVKGLRPVVETVDALLSKGAVIYGAGFIGEWVCSELQKDGINLLYGLDGNEQLHGTTLNDVEILAPTPEHIAAAPVIFITARHAVNTIKGIIDNHPCTISYDAYFVAKHYERLIAARALLADSRSVEVFNGILHALLTGSDCACIDFMEKDTYFALPQFSGTFNEIFVDAGAFVGDTVERFIWENLGTFKHIYAFEPGEQQFQAMETRVKRLVKEWALDPAQITLEQAGLGANNRRVLPPESPILIQNSLADSNQAPDGAEGITINSLDDYLSGRKVTFIKSDIEGMELELLAGVEQTIKKHHPKMVLSLYHYPTDLFTIIERVASISPTYRFSLRLHAPMLVDYMLYCY